MLFERERERERERDSWGKETTVETVSAPSSDHLGPAAIVILRRQGMILSSPWSQINNCFWSQLWKSQLIQLWCQTWLKYHFYCKQQLFIGIKLSQMMKTLWLLDRHSVVRTMSLSCTWIRFPVRIVAGWFIFWDILLYGKIIEPWIMGGSHPSAHFISTTMVPLYQTYIFVIEQTL